MDERERQEQLTAIEANVRLAVEHLGPLADMPFALDRASVVWVDGFIERQRMRTPDPGSLVSVLGCFVGACIVAATGGRWEWSEHGWGVRLPAGGTAFPLVKVRKQFADGRENGESIASFYDVAVEFLATGKLAERRP